MLVSFNSAPRKTVQLISLGSISKQMKGKKGMRKSVELQRADQPWPIWLLSLMKWLAGTREKGGAMRGRSSEYDIQPSVTPHNKATSFIILKTSPAMPTSHKYLSSAAKTHVAAPAFQDHFLLFPDTWTSSLRFACFSCFTSWDSSHLSVLQSCLTHWYNTQDSD